MTMVKIAAEVRTLSTRQAMMAGATEAPAGEPDQEGAARAHAGGLRRGEQAAIHAADDEDEEERASPRCRGARRGARASRIAGRAA